MYISLFLSLSLPPSSVDLSVYCLKYLPFIDR